MALLFFTGFENEDGYEGDYCSLSQSATQKRTGSFSGLCNANNLYLGFYYTGSEKTFIVGQALRISQDSYSGGFQISNSTGIQLCVQLVGSAGGNSVYLRRGDYNDTIIAQSTSSFYINTWYYLEAKITINNTTGSAIVKVDETEVINVSGVDTQAGSTDEITAFTFPLYVNSRCYIDDLYICDTTGSVNNDFLGPVRVEGLQPSGNGYNSDFVGSDADSTDNYLHVDEVPADDDTSYIKSSTNGHIDSFALGNLTGSVNSIKGIKVNSVAKVSDTFARNYKNLVRVNGTNYLGSDNNPDTSYNNNFDIWEEDPDTATGWTETGVNAIEVGVEITS